MRHTQSRGLGPHSRALFTPLFVLTLGGALLAAHAIMEATMGEEDTAAKNPKKAVLAADPGVSQLHGGITGTVPSDDTGGNGKWWEPASTLESEYRELVKKSAQTGGGASFMAAFRDSFQDTSAAVEGMNASVASYRSSGGAGLLAPAGPLNLSLWADTHPGVLNPPPLFRSTRNLLRSNEAATDGGSSGFTAVSSTFGSSSSTPRSWTSAFAAPDLVRASTIGTNVSRPAFVPAPQWTAPVSTFTPAIASAPVSTRRATLPAEITSTSTTTTTTSLVPTFTATAPVIETAPTTTTAPMTTSLVTLSGSSGTTTLSAPTASQSANIGYEFVTVGNPGNANDSGTNRVYGAVNYSYNIGKYDVTISQYTTFLNAVAQADTYSLYNVQMALDSTVAGIQRSGPTGSYTYSVIGDGQRPVTYVSWFDAARFANWMQNGQPTGLGEVAASTENGAYALNGQMTGIISRKAGAQVWIPTESEWYKAAYYDPSLNGGAGGYWQDATMGDGTLGNTVGNLPHQANYFNGTYSAGGIGGTTDVGAFSMSVSAYGTFDQSGNVYDWNDAVVFGSFRGLRGGAWDSSTQTALTSSDRNFSDPTDESRDFGFRLATIPEPMGWISLTTGAAMLLGRRRNKRSSERPKRRQT